MPVRMSPVQTASHAAQPAVQGHQLEGRPPPGARGLLGSTTVYTVQELILGVESLRNIAKSGFRLQNLIPTGARQG